MFDIGTGELILILVAALLLFGGRLPEVARNLGRTVGDLKRGFSESAKPLTEARNEIEREIEDAGGGKSPAGPPAKPPGRLEG